MNLHKTTFTDHSAPGTPTFAKWHGSAADASKARTELKRADRNCNPNSEAVDVPTDKAGLLEFLNALTDRKIN
jgi:hypothetical protein